MVFIIRPKTILGRLSNLNDTNVMVEADNIDSAISEWEKIICKENGFTIDNSEIMHLKVIYDHFFLVGFDIKRIKGLSIVKETIWVRLIVDEFEEGEGE